MLDRRFPPENRIIDCLRAHYDIDIQSMKALSEGADINASLYKARTHDHASYFVKLKLEVESDIHAIILERLQARGIEQVLPPIKTIHGHSTLVLDNVCITVYPFIEGVNGFSRKLTENQWMTLGRALRQIHSFDVPPSLLKEIRRESYSSKSRCAVRSLYAHIQEKPTMNDSIALQFAAFMKEHRAVIHRLIDRAEELSSTIYKQPIEYVFCHSDIHAGNVLIQGDDTFYIVDWDAPIIAPKEHDLMFIGGGVANVWNDPLEEAAFYTGYGPTHINIPILSYYRHERIVEDIAEYGQALLLTNPDNDHEKRVELYRQFVSMFDPHGVVEKAFTTDALLHPSI